MQHRPGATASDRLQANKVDTLYVKMSLTLLITEISFAQIIHHLDIVDDKAHDCNSDTPYAYQINIFLVRNHIDVNSVPLYFTIRCDLIKLIN